METLKADYKDKIKDFASVDRMKKQGEINDLEHRILRGFIQRLERNTSNPSQLDKIKVAQAYYDGTYDIQYVCCCVHSVYVQGIMYVRVCPGDKILL